MAWVEEHRDGLMTGPPIGHFPGPGNGGEGYYAPVNTMIAHGKPMGVVGKDPRLMPLDAGGRVFQTAGPVEWMSSFAPGQIERKASRMSKLGLEASARGLRGMGEMNAAEAALAAAGLGPPPPTVFDQAAYDAAMAARANDLIASGQLQGNPGATVPITPAEQSYVNAAQQSYLLGQAASGSPGVAAPSSSIFEDIMKGIGAGTQAVGGGLQAFTRASQPRVTASSSGIGETLAGGALALGLGYGAFKALSWAFGGRS